MQSKESANSLVQLAQLSASVESKLLEAGGEITPEIEELLAVVSEGLPAKVDAYKAIMERLALAEGFYSEKAKQYQSAAKSCVKAVERLKDNIKYAMRSMNATAIEGEDFKFTLSEMATKVVIKGEVPKEFMREVVKVEPDTDAIRSALVMGEELPFATLERVFALRSGIRKKA